MSKNYYQDFIFLGAHASAPFQQKILAVWFREISRQTPLETALDIGSGLGFNLPALSRFCSRIWATDISEVALRQSEKKHLKLKNISYLVCDAKNLKFPKEKFDLVLAMEVLEHLENQKEVISQCYRVLKRGGFLILSTPNYQNLTGLVKWYQDRKAGREYWDPWGAHTQGLEKSMTPGRLEQLLKNRFHILESWGANYLLAWFYFLPLRRFSDRFPFLALGKLPFIKRFGMDYYILAKKND